MMDRYREVIERILELLDTMKEGLDYVQVQLTELKYEEALVVIKDIVDALDSIYNSIQPMESQLPENNLVAFTASIKYNLDNVIKSYEQGKEAYVSEQIEKGIVPSFLVWKKEIERVLRPYVIS